MSILYELRRRAGAVVGPVIGICVAGYFAYHVVQGERGVYAWMALDQELVLAEATLTELRTGRERIANRVRLLHPQSLDADMLDEQVRAMLGYGRPNEIVVLHPRSGS